MSTLTQPAQPPEPAAPGYEQETGSKKRLIGVVIAVLLHALLIYGFTSGLASDIVQKVQRTVNVAIVPETKPPPPPPEPVEEIEADSRPRQTQQRAPTKAFVPKAEVETKQASTDTISGVTDKVEEATPAIEKAAPVVPDAPPAKPSAPVKTMARLMKGCRLPQYPKRSEEKGEEGVVVLRFLVGTDGAVQSAQLVSSSGFERLDTAAREAFMKCKFTPGTVDGVSVTSWVRQPFTWRLK
ncbi:MAG: energy transducer TonB [Myxococcales bacterium]|nr:MAG: energy transducer TonB [Myxococcales bacterium]